jgi:hypothetical protein
MMKSPRNKAPNGRTASAWRVIDINSRRPFGTLVVTTAQVVLDGLQNPIGPFSFDFTIKTEFKPRDLLSFIERNTHFPFLVCQRASGRAYDFKLLFKVPSILRGNGRLRATLGWELMALCLGSKPRVKRSKPFSQMVGFDLGQSRAEPVGESGLEFSEGMGNDEVNGFTEEL